MPRTRSRREPSSHHVRQCGQLSVRRPEGTRHAQFNDFPTISDKLQVLGDIRVGTTGTNGCIKDFGGNALAGTCSSDRRLKKDITPFDPVLDRLTALQPVRYFWRASEFPDRQFGDARAYGLIAQDVEQALPELVVTNDDGFKAVDYSKLPLLTIQAVKDLKSRVQELKTENDTLTQRLTELERLVAELLAAPRR
jgi:Chaperone of endosialidase